MACWYHPRHLSQNWSRPRYSTKSFPQYQNQSFWAQGSDTELGLQKTPNQKPDKIEKKKKIMKQIPRVDPSLKFYKLAPHKAREVDEE